jgi:hypothetical protein
MSPGFESGPESQLIQDLFRGLAGTFLDGEMILGGSSGLFGFPTATPAFTEDLDFLIREDHVASRGAEIVDLLKGLGYEHVPETPTFTSPGRPTFDLVGYSSKDFIDHLSLPGGPLRVMVFGDLGAILREGCSVQEGPSGGRVLTPAGFCAAKLMTLRVEKGAKDKLQALLVVAEREPELAFCECLRRIFSRFDGNRRNDAVADAQMAFLSLQRDPEFRDRGAEGYLKFLERVESGYRALLRILVTGSNA